MPVNAGPRLVLLALSAGSLLLSLTTRATTAPASGPSRVRLVTRETVIARPHIMVSPESMVFSPDARRVAYTILRGRQRTVCLDGVEQGTYEGVETLHFSPEGKRLAFWALRGGRYEMVVDGRAQSKLYDGCWRWLGTTLVVTNGNIEFAERSHELRFSPDGRHLAYVGASRPDTRPRPRVLLDGEEIGMHEGLVDCGLVFSPDSRRLGYVVADGTNYVATIDRQPRRAYEEGVVLPPTCFSADGQRLSYFAKKSGKHWVVIDDTEVGPFDQVGMASLAFSPDARHLAFKFVRDGRSFVWRDGREEGGLENLAGITFSPDSQRLAYLGYRQGKWFAVVDGSEGPAWDGIAGLPEFSPDSKRFAYGARRGPNAAVVLDGQEGPAHPQAKELRLRFSPDSQHLACAVLRPGRSVLVVDGREGPAYDAIFEFVFTGPRSLRLLARRYDEMAQAEIIRAEIEIGAE